MKKFIYIIALALATALLSSCAKQHTCPTYLKVKNYNADQRV